MNLKDLSDDALHNGNIRNAKEEREILTRNLHCLRETERRRLFSKHKCKSLFDYAVKFLLYSSDQADRRIKSMRLLRDMPDIEANINNGALNLTNLALAQKLFDLEKKSGNELELTQKTQILERLENKTTREAEKVVFEIRPEMKSKKNELKYENIDDDQLRAKLLQVKGLYTHASPGMSLTELLHKLCDQEIEKKTKASRAPKMDSKAEIAREVWRRDESQCRNCGSTHALEIEHIQPKSAGGEWTLENLCLLCRSCNQRSAIEFYGMAKMDKYFNLVGG